MDVARSGSDVSAVLQVVLANVWAVVGTLFGIALLAAFVWAIGLLLWLAIRGPQ